LGQLSLGQEDFPQKKANFLSCQAKKSLLVRLKNNWVKVATTPYLLWIREESLGWVGSQPFSDYSEDKFFLSG